MNILMKKAASGLTALSILAGAFAATAAPAAAGTLNVAPAVATTAATTEADANVIKAGWRHRNYRWHRNHWRPYARWYGPRYYAYRVPHCFWKRVTQKRWNRYGRPYFVKARIRVCR